MDDEFRLTPVGVVRSPYETPDDAPHQGFAAEAESTLEFFEASADGLRGIDDVYRLTVLYWADLADRSALVADDGVGAFARRGPDRPNPVSVCTCTVVRRAGRSVVVSGLDAVDGSPLLDVKPALQAER